MAKSLPDVAYVTAMAELDGVGPARLRHLLDQGEPSKVWSNIVNGTLTPVAGHIRITDSIIKKWRHQAQRSSPEESLRRIKRSGIGAVIQGDDEYPEVLVDDPEPPAIIFYQGDLDALSARRVGIIGTRQSTGYGQQVAKSLSYDLSEAGVAIVSGLALGIDAAAHLGVFGAKRALPIGVVGAGLDRPCPRRNQELAEHIGKHGLLLSEVPLGVPAAPWRFPVRNRIIAALSEILVVVESSAKGGSMHTVREALNRDRLIFAVPGPVGSLSSAGTNQLLSEGAQVFTSSDDVASALDLIGTESVSILHQHHNQVRLSASQQETTTVAVSHHKKTRVVPSGTKQLSTENRDDEPDAHSSNDNSRNDNESNDGATGQELKLFSSPQVDEDFDDEAAQYPTGIARDVLAQITWELMSFDQVALKSNIDLVTLSQALRELERNNWIQRRDGWVQRVR